MQDFRTPEGFSKEYIERHQRFLAPLTIGPDENFVFARAKGTRLWDASGKEYIDFNASVGTSALGHNHPLIAEVQARQQEVLDFVEGTTFYYCFELEIGGKRYEISPAALSSKLLGLMFPDYPWTRGVFGLGGADAVNIATKLCLKAQPGKHRFINFKLAFHGRYGYALDFTNSKRAQKKHYPSSGITVHSLPYPVSYESYKAALEELNTIPLDDLNAVIYEPLQGEGGFRWPDQKYMHDLLALLAREGALLIDDEIQAGLGRTGKWFAFQHGDFDPHIVICGKPLGGGSVPVSFVGYKRAIFDNCSRREDEILEVGWHSGTFPMYPKSVASAIVFLDIMERDNVLENVCKQSILLEDILENCSDPPCGGGVVDYLLRTGFGLMQGLEFRRHNSHPDPKWRNSTLLNLRSANPIGILTLSAGNDGINPTIRFEPCLTCTREELEYLGVYLKTALYL